MRVLAVPKTAEVVSLAFSPDGSRLLAGCRGADMRLWDVASGRAAVRLENSSNVAPAFLLPDGQVLASPPGERVRVWLADGTRRYLSGDDSRWTLVGADVSPNGERFVRLTPYSQPLALHCRAIADGDLVWRGEAFAHNRWDEATARYSPTGHEIALACVRVHIFDADTGEPLRTLAPPVRQKPGTHALAFRPDGAALALVRLHGVCVLDPVAGDEQAWLPVRTARGIIEVGPVAFTPDGRLAFADGETVRFFDSSTWRELPAFAPEVGRVTALAFSPDGMLAAAGGKGKVALWDLA